MWFLDYENGYYSDKTVIRIEDLKTVIATLQTLALTDLNGV